LIARAIFSFCDLYIVKGDVIHSMAGFSLHCLMRERAVFRTIWLTSGSWALLQGFNQRLCTQKKCQMDLQFTASFEIGKKCFLFLRAIFSFW
jgi:hypothetical protein